MNRSTKSVFEAMSQAHAGLLKQLKRLEEAVRSSKKTDTTALNTRLRTMRERLLEHFHFEEQNGYMDAVRKREPRLERAIQDLLEDHRLLAQSLDALIEQAHAGKDATLPAGVRKWIQRLQQHEAGENALIEDAYNLDIGNED